MIELFGKKHDKESFDCGNERLNLYLKRLASQDVKRKLAACYRLSKTILAVWQPDWVNSLTK